MSFKNIDWTAEHAAGGSRMIPAGGYVAIITAVEDVDSREYLRFTYDIAEGPCAGFFADDDREYTHQFTRSYTAKARGFMKRFLDCIEASNDNFSLSAWNGDERDLVGKKVGVLIQREDYTNRDGEDRARMNVEGYTTANDIRANKFKLPEPKDSRDKSAAVTAAPADAYADDADIPFL